MEKPLKLVCLSSLKEIALRRVGVLLFINSDIMTASLTQTPFLSSTNIREWQNIIEAKMVELELPESLKKQILDYIPAIGFQIKRWEVWKGELVYSFLSPLKRICLTDPSKLCWTAAGAIDDRKTAEQVVSCHLLSVEQLYKIACFYCLENHIPLLWEDLPAYKKELCGEHRTEHFLEFCWLHILKGELSGLDYLWRESGRNLTSFHQWAFEKSALDDNQAASEYFFHRLTPAERAASLMRSVHSVLGTPNRGYLSWHRHSDILCYLLSLLTPERQMEIVRERPVDVLVRFLDLKHQDLFSVNAGLIWTFITPDSHSRLLHLMNDLISKTDCYVPRLLRELLEHSPLDFKKYFVKPPYVYFLFERFFDSNDSESLRTVFGCLDATDRVKIVFTDCVLGLFHQSLSEDRWQVVEVCLREAALSKEDRERLRHAFTRFHGEGRALDGKLRRFFEILDATADVRSCCPE